MDAARWCHNKTQTSTSFLLLVSLAFSSMGVNPSNCAHRCALVVFPMPGDLEIMTAQKIFMPCLRGLLKPQFRFASLCRELISDISEGGKLATHPVAQPLL